MWKTITVLVCVLCFMSCIKTKNNEVKDKLIVTDLTDSDSIFISDNVINFISSYMEKYPNFNSFVLICAPKRYLDFEYQTNSNYDYIVGPAYEGLFINDSYPLFFYKINDKTIFIKEPMERLIFKKQESDYYEKCQISRGTDSIINEAGWVIKDGKPLFYHRALLFSINNNNEISILSNKPDTVFLPIYTKTIQWNIK